MTLTPDAEKKTTTIDVYATDRERQAADKLIKQVRERLIFDIDAKRLKKNKKAIQGAADETGASDPMMYIKLDNFLDKLGNAIRTNATAATLDMGPNEFSKETGDMHTNRIYTRALASVLRTLDQDLVKRKAEGSALYPSKFEVVQVFDLSQIEGITSGTDLKKRLKKGDVIPEYGLAKLPPADRLYGLRGSKKILANRLFTVVVKDTEEEGLTHDLQSPIKMDGGKYGSFVKYKKIKVGGVSPTTLNGYRENGKLKPKTKLELLQMGVALTLGMNESLISPIPALKPQIMKLPDPDSPIGEKRSYYIFTFSGYTGARTAAVRPGTEDVLTGVQTIPDVENPSR